MDGEQRKGAADKVDLLYADGTKAHGLDGKKNTVNVVVGKDLETGDKNLLGLTVNRSWVETAGQVTARAGVLVSDADKEMRNALIGKALSHQLCVNHEVREVNNHLWRASLPREERKLIRAKLRIILRTLRNSTSRHLVDMDFERLGWRIDWALGMLKGLARELAEEGLTGTARFIRNSANYLVPHTNNLVERLMGEVAKRVKNRWMH